MICFSQMVLLCGNESALCAFKCIF